MSSPAAPTDVQYLRCLKCLKIIKCSRYDTSCLVHHVQKDHPEILADTANEKLLNLHKLAAEHGISQERLSEISKMTGLSEVQMADEAERYLQRKSQGDAREPTRSAPMTTDSRELGRRQFYRSSIERWVPTEGCIYCPSCGVNRRPVIKTSSEFYTSTGCPASCVANCWPFCFLPCLQSSDNREYLHCANCKSFLGIYDRESNCIRPNREFVPSTK
ncbi:uncharacterized protein LOC6579220 isoform X2 [Drosophila mojavensis]|uniref:Uncharacterized protein, isoform A n=2 Tax=Drosophila mojavensis TaxID=7230 RepID=B4KP75_DROMO|nr:uncharacterized protein LOC6579220 isoform X2 [Drosophila mojavensis]EDW09051.1 uncharacterized protein Dmoj_GI20297, isoform A [Drosophila mojavensis]KRG04433.1 uncharacterized protein Dmoj_GI20297, isoform B [Drosophila mojavensis]